MSSTDKLREISLFFLILFKKKMKFFEIREAIIVVCRIRHLIICLLQAFSYLIVAFSSGIVMSLTGLLQ